MKKIFALFCAAALSAGAAAAVEPVLLGTARSGSIYRMTDYALVEDGEIVVVVAHQLSESEKTQTAALLQKQGTAPEEAAGLASNEFSLRYAADGSVYRHLYDRYLAADGRVIRERSLNHNTWQATPSNPNLIVAKALLASAQRLNLSVALPPSSRDNATSASQQSAALNKPIEASALIAAFRADRPAFESDYENALIQVRGKVGDKGSAYDLASLQLLAGKDAVLALFDKDSEPQLNALRKGQTVVLGGAYRRGNALGAVFILDRCEVISAK